MAGAQLHDGAAPLDMGARLKRDDDGCIVEISFYHGDISASRLDAFRQAPELTQLILYYCNTTDEDLRTICEYAPALEVLLLNHCRATTDQSLPTILGLRSLNWLSFFDTRMTAAAESELRRKLPSAHLIGPSG